MKTEKGFADEDRNQFRQNTAGGVSSGAMG
jgi:hypothetical protein